MATNPPELPSKIQEILAVCPKFRILVVGKSGVGKSSIVSSVFNISKEKTGVQHHQVGTASIESEFTSSSNILFILHDSQGFEPGSDASLGTATHFISDRCDASKKLKDRLHAIWLCLETPRSGSRLLQSGDEKILEIATERKGVEVAVVIVFTKFDLLVNQHFQVLQSSNESSENIEERATEMAKIDLQQQIDELARKFPKIRFAPVFADELDEYESEANVNSHSDDVHLNRGSLETLTDTTLEVIGDLRILWVMAQQINVKQKVESSIENGFKWYWLKLGINTMSYNIPLLRCLTGIRDDILSVWNLHDPEESLKSVDFNTKMFNLIKPLLQKLGPPSHDTLGKSNELADLAGKISPGLEKALAYAGLLGLVANILLDRIEASPMTALCLGAYVVDLTIILHDLFYITLNLDPPRPVSEASVSATFENYQQYRAERVHARVRAIAYGATLRLGEEIEALVRTELGIEA